MTGGRTPEELESLLEDAVVLRDAPAVAALFEPCGVLVAEPGVSATGRTEVGRAAAGLWPCGYVADPRRVLRVRGLALVVGARSVTVARRGEGGSWHYVFVVRTGTEFIEEDPPMHTMMVRMSTDPARREEVVRHLRNDIVPWASSRPGFVSGRWLLAVDGTEGAGLIVFDSAETAASAAEAPRTYARDDGRAWNIEGVEVYEQVATSCQEGGGSRPGSYGAGSGAGGGGAEGAGGSGRGVELR